MCKGLKGNEKSILKMLMQFFFKNSVFQCILLPVLSLLPVSCCVPQRVTLAAAVLSLEAEG